MKWYIGQRVVAIQSVSSNRGATGIVKGKCYVIQAISKRPCCGKGIIIDVGIDNGGRFTMCLKCGEMAQDGNVWWFCETAFAPLDELSDYTVETLLNEIEIVNV